MIARVPFSLGELVGGGGCNCAGDGDWNWGTGLRLRPPSPNKHSGEEGLHWLGRGRASGAERGARDQARSPGDVGLRGGGFQGGLRDGVAGAPKVSGCTCPWAPRSRTGPGHGPSRAGGTDATVAEPDFPREVNPTHPTRVGIVQILQTRGLSLNPWVPSVNLRGNHPLPRPVPQLALFPPTSSPTLVPVPFSLDLAPPYVHPPRASALLLSSGFFGSGHPLLSAWPPLLFHSFLLLLFYLCSSANSFLILKRDCFKQRGGAGV